MLTEIGVIRADSVGEELKDVNKFKKGVIQIESPDGLYLNLCFPIANAGRDTYAKYFLIPDLFAERVIQKRICNPLQSDSLKHEYPLNKILGKMGAAVKIDGNFCIYTVTREFLDDFDPKRITKNKSRVDLSNKNRPFRLINIKGTSLAYWDGKKFNYDILECRDLRIISMPIEIV